MLSRLVMLAVLGLTTSACLITDRVEFEDPENVPPFVTVMVPAANQVVVQDATATASVEFTAYVMDMNVEDDLDARVFLDYELSTHSIHSTPPALPSQTDERVRVIKATFSPRDFDRGCHVIEMVIADDPSGWEGDDNRSVRAGVGTTTATWFVLARLGSRVEDPAADISLFSCPNTDPEPGVQ